MTIGSRKGSTRSSLRAPKFLDKSGGFYGRLDEPEVPSDVVADMEEEKGRWDGVRRTAGVQVSGAAPGSGDPGGEGFDANDGVTEGDDGETLLRVKLGRSSSRWRSRRSSRRKQRESPSEQGATPDESLAPGPETAAGLAPAAEVTVTDANEPMGTLVHFTAREDDDDQVLIRDKKRGREEEEEEEEEGEGERRLKRDQEEGMKALKRNTVKNYRKALDRAFRRGWEAFITNLYSVTLTPVNLSTTSSSSPSPKFSQNKPQSNVILAEVK
ncbi:hypothetical protein N1851_032403 [Merluccius polli]|uniref:Uncharacterized protein n=1 Tax=Merluccius polli TaxID=89951 RepID=A0AA47M2Y3_MERPO|nr:hypothetical protein N1851_032403 [Merluccius polli]